MLNPINRHSSHQKHSQRQQGFTLIEVLLAITIFAVLSMAGYQVINQVQRSNVVSSDTTKRLEEVQRAMLIMDNDFRQFVDRKYSTDGQEKQLILAGKGTLESTDNGILFVRSGWQNPQNMFPRGEVLKVGYRLAGNILERVWWQYPDAEVGQGELVRPLLNDVESFSFRFYNDGRWQDAWTQTQKLPQGIEVIFTLADYGEIHRFYSLPSQMAKAPVRQGSVTQ